MFAAGRRLPETVLFGVPILLGCRAPSRAARVGAVGTSGRGRCCTNPGELSSPAAGTLLRRFKEPPSSLGAALGPARVVFPLLSGSRWETCWKSAGRCYFFSCVTVLACEPLEAGECPPASPLVCPHSLWRVGTSAAKPLVEAKKKEDTTLGGGSLGSCVDEERSQLRELM